MRRGLVIAGVLASLLLTALPAQAVAQVTIEYFSFNPFTITLASASQTGFTFDIQRKGGANAWTRWKTGVTSLSVTFKPTSTGTYRFRSRLHKTSNNATSAYSPAKAITVS